MAQFYNTGGPGGGRLYWSYGSQPSIIVPTSNYQVVNDYVNNVPLNIKISSSWGNGYKSYNEEWDDGNNINYDGWSSNWKTEKLNNSNIDLWFWIFLAILIAGALCNLATQIIWNYSVSSIFGFINEVQLILLLPMLPYFIPQFLQNFIAKLNYCIFSFSFLYNYISQHLVNVEFKITFDQPSYYFGLMDIRSGSNLINIQGNLLTLFKIIWIHLLFLSINYWLRNKHILPWYLKWIRTFKNFMTFGIYIQYATSSVLLVWLISSTEIQRFDHSTTTYTISLSFAFIIQFIVFSYFLFAIYKWYQWRDVEKFRAIKYTKQLFDSIKESNISRTFIIKYLFQRILFWLMAALWNPSNTYPKIGVYSLIQLIFFLYTVILRPFNNIKDNLLEIVNEVHYVVLTSSLLFLNYESNWSQVKEIVYLAIIFSNNIIVCLISLIFLIKAASKSVINGKIYS